MKKIFYIFISLIMIFLVTGCISTVSIGYYKDSDKYLVGSQEYTGELSTLDVDWVSGTLTLIEDETSEKITITEENDLEDDKKVHSYFNNGTLYVKFAKSGLHASIDNKKKNLEIRYKDVKTLLVTLTSGECKVNKINAEDFKLVVTSGSFKADEITSKDVRITLTSGSTTINELSTESLSYNHTSGSCYMSLKKCDNASFDMTSGRVELEIRDDIATKVVFKKVSGSLKSDKTFTKVGNEYTFGPMDKEVTSNIDFDVTSGTLVIK